MGKICFWVLNYCYCSCFNQWAMCPLLTCFLLWFWLIVEGNQVPASSGFLASVIGSVGLKDVDLREDESELAAKLLGLLAGDWILRLPYHTWNLELFFHISQ